MIDALIFATQYVDIVSEQTSDTRHEIVVTGERIARSEHDTASSVAILDADKIDALVNPDRIEQLLQSVANVQLGSGGEGPVIRGQDSTGVVRDLPAFLSGTRPRTTITVDGRSSTYYELAFGLTSVWDLERVEVFRSPQSTTQGRNSIGGAIFVLTKDPAFDWEAGARLLIGNYATRQISGVASGPLVPDELAFRLSGDLRRSRTASRISNGAVGIDPNRDDSELVRAKLLARPKNLSGTELALTYTHGRSQMPQIEGIEPPYAERRNPAATYGIFRIAVDSITGRFSYEPSGDLQARATVSYGHVDARRYPTPGLGDAVIDARDLSIEPVVVWHAPSGLSLTGGLNYIRATLAQTIKLTTFSPVLGTGAFSDVQHSMGLFGEGSIPLTSKLTLTAGLRYQTDKQARKGGLTGIRLTLPLDYKGRFSAWLPKMSLAWDISPLWRVGLLAQRAYNPGGVNLNTARARVEAFDAEYLWDFELFTRARMADGRLTLSANVFRYAMSDAQRTQSVLSSPALGPPILASQVDNAPRAMSKGLELGLDWQPSRHLKIVGSAGLLDTKITRTLDPRDPMLGKQFQRSPHFTGSAGVLWKPVDPFQLSVQVRHNSSYFSDDLETVSRRIAGSTTVDAKAAWTWHGITLTAYARNLFDEFHLTYLFGNRIATAGDPRELGMGIEAKF